MKRAVLGILALSAAMAGCAGSTVGSGVGDRFFVQPPYYAGTPNGRALPVGALPVAIQLGNFFEARSGGDSPLDTLVAGMNARLSAMEGVVTLEGPALPGAGPDVSLGCELDATGECVLIDPADPYAVQLRLAVTRSSGKWITALRERAGASGVDAVLVITLEVGQYWVQQRNALGAKEVRLGTGLVQPVPWLTSLEAPVEVLQLTGALVNPEGRALRIGAEGLLARRTDLVMSGFGAQALLRDDDIRALQSQRRDDLPGHPLVWEAALDLLVQSLLGG
ncbi:MAG TPA: hypothetical protein PKA66_12685 [Gemmatimonadales bacterium]|nr:hypothetical protein [Gemmatimonadales bacterium]